MLCEAFGYFSMESLPASAFKRDAHESTHHHHHPHQQQQQQQQQM